MIVCSILHKVNTNISWLNRVFMSFALWKVRRVMACTTSPATERLV